MTILVLVLASQASAAPATLSVNAATGSDANPGTATQPLKTLGKALKLAGTGATVKLAGGVYGPGFSGDQFPAAGLAVPSGVAIVGATDSGFPTATLLGPGSGVGLNLAGNATVRNLVWGGQGFGVGLYAKQGKQTLTNLFLATSKASAVIDGSTTSAGILLRGTAQANLTASTLFVNTRTGVAVQQQARLVAHGGQINLGADAQGVFVSDQGRFTMDGGKTTGGAPNCGLDATAIALHDAAQATLQNGARLENVPGFGLLMDGTSKAALNTATISREATAGCSGRPSVDARGAATLTANGATIAAVGGQDVDGISSHDTVTLTLTDTDVRGHTGSGIDLDGNEHLTLSRGSVGGNGIGVEARAPAGASGAKKTPHIKITGTSVIGNGIGIQVDEPIFKLRDSKVIFNVTGIESIGAVGGIAVGDECAFACVNLGFGPEPGGNNVTGNSDTGIRFRTGDSRPSGLCAEGNLWNSNTQGSDGNGLYTSELVLRGIIPDPRNQGRNFVLPNGSNTLIQLAGCAIGRLRLTPDVLHARPGKVAHLRMSWTHPHSWKQLSDIQLRLYRGAKAVARVGVRPSSGRLSASGAIALIADASRLTHHGKTVTAELAVRLSRSLAGGKLRVVVEATDRNGQRQLESRAARITVAG